MVDVIQNLFAKVQEIICFFLISPKNAAKSIHFLKWLSVGQFDTVSQLIASSVSLQLAVIGLIIGIIIISVVYRKFSFWVKTQKFNHVRPHVARFARKIILPFLAIALISSVNMYIQVFELFDEESTVMQIEGELAPSEVFAKNFPLFLCIPTVAYFRCT